MKSSAVPVRVAEVKGVKYILDNRSAAALVNAAIPTKFWNIQNVTKNMTQQGMTSLLQRLKREKIKVGQIVTGSPAQTTNQ